MQTWQSLAVLAAANLGIADEVGSEPVHIDQLAQRLRANPATLFRLMRGLSAKGIFRDVGERRFVGNALSDSLKTGAPGGAREIIRSLGLKSTRAASAFYETAIVSGLPAFERAALHSNTAERLREMPEERAIYDRGMTAAAVVEAEAIVEAFDFSRFREIVDIGGGHGTLLSRIIERHPGQRGTLFDVPEVVSHADTLFRNKGIHDRCRIRAGDFRHDLPPRSGDAYVLKNVLHGYSDADSEQLLRLVRQCGTHDAHVVIIELVMLDTRPSSRQTTFDLFLLLGGAQSRVRSDDEFRCLLNRAGFELLHIIPTTLSLCVIDAQARDFEEKVHR
jgi:hypothetical protein